MMFKYNHYILLTLHCDKIIFFSYNSYTEDKKMAKSNRIPLYITILDILRERVVSGTYGLNSLLPTESDLVIEFGVSKITIRKAIEKLEIEGLVEKRSGYGTKVISNGLYNTLTRSTSFSRTLEQEGYSFRRENSHIDKITLEPQDELYQYFGPQCYKISRMYFLNGKPYIYYTHYLPGNMELDQLDKDKDFSIYMQLYKTKKLISTFQDEFYIDYPSTKILEALQLKDVCTLGRKRTTFGVNGDILEISYSQYNSHLHNYVIKFDV